MSIVYPGCKTNSTWKFTSLPRVMEKNSWWSQGVSQEGKKLCALHELGNKVQLGVCMGHCELLSGLIVGPGGKPLENIQYLADKEIIK